MHANMWNRTEKLFEFAKFLMRGSIHVNNHTLPNNQKYLHIFKYKTFIDQEQSVTISLFLSCITLYIVYITTTLVHKHIYFNIVPCPVRLFV